MTVTKTSGGCIRIEYTEDDIREVNERYGMHYQPHAGVALHDAKGSLVSRRVPDDVRPPLTLHWHLIDRAMGRER